MVATSRSRPGQSQEPEIPSWSLSPICMARAQTLQLSSTASLGAPARNCIGSRAVETETHTPIWGAGVAKQWLNLLATLAPLSMYLFSYRKQQSVFSSGIIPDKLMIYKIYFL